MIASDSGKDRQRNARPAPAPDPIGTAFDKGKRKDQEQ